MEETASLTEKLSAIVFGRLADRLPADIRREGTKLLKIDEAKAKREMGIDSQREALSVEIALAYRLNDIKAIIEASTFAAREMHRLFTTMKTRGSSRLVKQLRAAFGKPYIGNAHRDFILYLVQYWKKYKNNRTRYFSPVAALIQSSGFGKSRLLYEVAEMTANDADIVSSIDGTSVRVLYICARKSLELTGFPVATPVLADSFFGSNCTVDSMTAQLVRAFNYAQQHWENVGSDWLKLFADPEADFQVSAAITAPQTLAVDSECRGLNRVLVLPVDEALALFDRRNAHGAKVFDLFHRALEAANAKLFVEEGYSGGIFVVMSDSNPKVYDFKYPSSSRTYQQKEDMFLSPFILTHTTDIHLKTPGRDTDYKSRVTLKDLPRELHAKVEWNGLVSMGRPLWNATTDKDVAASQQKIVSDLAAKKLLRGQSISRRASYNGSTMFGVESVLCRLGLKPRSDIFLSMRAVAGFMGVLSYIFFRNDEYLTCYPPEPVLAFGAARLWYQLQSTTDRPTALEEFMMPRFRDMILEEALDMTGTTTDVIAARIFLLLAMDDTIMRSSKAKTLDKCDFVFAGQFCAVRQLLHTLGGAHPVLKTSWLGDPTEEQNQDHREWMTSWSDWKVGFSQFHDLNEEPTEEVLWFLLDRRAAGVLCPKEKRAHVVIPIFSGDTLSYILVQVKSRMKDVGCPRQFPSCSHRECSRVRIHCPRFILAR